MTYIFYENLRFVGSIQTVSFLWLDRIL